MKLRSLFFPLLAIFIIGGALFTGCTQTNTPTTTTTAYHDTVADVTGLSDGTVYKFNITGGASSQTKILGVSSYQNNTVRVFWQRAVGDTNQITVVTNSTASDAIAWSPADFTGPIRIYETGDAAVGHPSGLVLGSHSTTLSVSAPTATSTVDFVLATDNSLAQPRLVFVSADDGRSLITGTPRAADMGTIDIIQGGLAQDYLSTPITNIPSPGAGSFVIPTNNGTKSVVIPVRTADNPPHYARIEILPQASNNNALWGNTTTPGASDNRYYIDVNVVYQSTTSAGYVDRPQAARHATPSLRAAAPTRVIN